MKILVFTKIIMLIVCLNIQAQNIVSLKNLDEFQSQAGNWFVVGDVIMDRTIEYDPFLYKDFHNKRHKKNGNHNYSMPINFKEGTGILLNVNNETLNGHIITKWEHGDILLELDLMVPNGSNSGIYLQGRYEVQILDSWHSKSPKFTDLGGIYRNWEEDKDKRLYGVPPLYNAAKAPGLWQHLKIRFQAPKFNSSGEKTSNAKFLYVELNGVRIHTNVEVPLPTGGPITKIEVDKGPLMIQGSHGAVAIKNIRYTRYEENLIKITGLTYKGFSGNFSKPEELENEILPFDQGVLDLVDATVLNKEDNYGLIFSGELQIPVANEYTFFLGHTGGMEFVIDGVSILSSIPNTLKGVQSKSIFLEAGNYPFQIFNYKSAAWYPPSLGFWINGKGISTKYFNDFKSYSNKPPLISSIYVDVGSRPMIFRGFIQYKNINPKLTHTIAIGTPQRVHFIYDANSSRPIGFWRGDFIETTPMWHDRGDGSFLPRGAIQWTYEGYPLVELRSIQDNLSNEHEKYHYTHKGYTIDSNSGLPKFNYTYKNIQISDYLYPDSNNRFIIHEVIFGEINLENLYYKIASGTIRKLADGSYLVNDHEYYINIKSKQNPTIRTLNGNQELIIPVDGSNIKYEIIW